MPGPKRKERALSLDGVYDDTAMELTAQQLRPKSSVPQLLTYNVALDLVDYLDAGDVLECYLLTRQTYLHYNFGSPTPNIDAPNSTQTDAGRKIPIQTTALGLRYRPPSGGSKPPLDLTLEYGPNREGKDNLHLSVPVLQDSDNPFDDDSWKPIRVTWANEGQVYYTTQISQDDYVTANFMASLTGAVLSDLLATASVYPTDHRRYQPWEVVTDDVSIGGDQAKNRPKRVLFKSNSDYDFVHFLFQRLASVGVDLSPVLNPIYYRLRLNAVGIQRKALTREAQKDMAIFYQNLYSCLESLATASLVTAPPSPQPTNTPTASFAPTATISASPTPVPTSNNTEGKNETTQELSESPSGSPLPDTSDNYQRGSNPPTNQPRKARLLESSGDVVDAAIGQNQSNLEDNKTPGSTMEEHHGESGASGAIPAMPNPQLGLDTESDEGSALGEPSVANENNDGNGMHNNVTDASESVLTPVPSSATSPLPSNFTEPTSSLSATPSVQPSVHVDMPSPAPISHADAAASAAAAAQQAADAAGDNPEQAAEAAKQAADAALKAATATVQQQAALRQEALLSGNGVAMAQTASICLSDPLYGIAVKGSNSSTIYLYRDSTYYYTVQVIAPYIQVVPFPASLPKPSQAPLIQQGLVVDWALALILIGFLLLSILLILQNVLGRNLHVLPSLYRFQRWFFNPRKIAYDDVPHTDEAKQQQLVSVYPFGQNSIPRSMGGVRLIKGLKRTNGLVPDGEETQPTPLCFPLEENDPFAGSARLGIDDEALGDVELSTRNSSVMTHGNKLFSSGSSFHDEEFEVSPLDGSGRFFRDPELVQLPDLKSTSKVAVPVSSVRQSTHSHSSASSG
ncbi:hypothetical protein ACA910_021563 [Epithemia clementina (nom. ined.)]